MLHDPSHYEPPPIAHEIEVSQHDREILRRLAAELAEIAALPVHAEKARLWQQLNDLKSARPMVWINEIPWHEMNVDDELTLRTSDPWAQDQERDLRRTLYQWRHLPGDMIVNDFIACPLAVHSTDFGIIEDVELARTDDANDIVSREFHIQIRDFDDLEKIKMPVVTHNEAATEFRYQAMCEVYDGIMPVRKQGQTHIWYTPWDYLIRWWGVQEAMLDLVDATGPGPRRRGAHGGRLDGGAGPVRCHERALARLRQHAHRLGRLWLHGVPAGRAVRPRLGPAAQHVGLLQRPDLQRCLTGDATGSSPSNTICVG